MSVVYFVQRGAGLIKIGVSVDVAKRIEALRCGHPEDLTLLLTVPGSFEEETLLHRHFADLRVRGEWFQPEPELFAMIDWLRDHPEKLVARMMAERTMRHMATRALVEDTVDRLYELVEDCVGLMGGPRVFAGLMGRPERDVLQRLRREVVGGHVRQVHIDWLAYFMGHPTAERRLLSGLCEIAGLAPPVLDPLHPRWRERGLPAGSLEP